MDACIVLSSCLDHFCCVSDLLLNTHVPLHVELLSFVLLSRAVFLLQRQLTEAMDSDLFVPRPAFQTHVLQPLMREKWTWVLLRLSPFSPVSCFSVLADVLNAPDSVCALKMSDGDGTCLAV